MAETKNYIGVGPCTVVDFKVTSQSKIGHNCKQNKYRVNRIHTEELCSVTKSKEKKEIKKRKLKKKRRITSVDSRYLIKKNKKKKQEKKNNNSKNFISGFSLKTSNARGA